MVKLFLTRFLLSAALTIGYCSFYAHLTLAAPKSLVLSIASQPSKNYGAVLSAQTITTPELPLALLTAKPQQLEVTATPTTTPTPTPTTPLATPTATATPTTKLNVQAATVQTPANPGGLNADVLFRMVNDHRKSLGLAELQKDARACSVAAARAPQIDAEIATGTMHAGLRAMQLPYWNSENIISMQTEQEAFTWWMNDTIHRQAIEGAYTYSCLVCSGKACAQEFTNFQAK